MKFKLEEIGTKIKNNAKKAIMIGAGLIGTSQVAEAQKNNQTPGGDKPKEKIENVIPAEKGNNKDTYAINKEMKPKVIENFVLPADFALSFSHVMPDGIPRHVFFYKDGHNNFERIIKAIDNRNGIVTLKVSFYISNASKDGTNLPGNWYSAKIDIAKIEGVGYEAINAKDVKIKNSKEETVGLAQCDFNN